MRIPVLILMSFTVTSAAGAETLRLPPAAPPQQSGKTLPLKSASEAARANGCAAYGQGFMMVSGTCVKIGGTVSVDAVTRR